MAEIKSKCAHRLWYMVLPTSKIALPAGAPGFKHRGYFTFIPQNALNLSTPKSEANTELNQ